MKKLHGPASRAAMLDLSMANALSRAEKPAFDRSKVFMVCMLNFDEFRRLHVVMQGGHSFDIDSHQVPFSLDTAADWLMGDI